MPSCRCFDQDTSLTVACGPALECLREVRRHHIRYLLELADEALDALPAANLFRASATSAHCWVAAAMSGCKAATASSPTSPLVQCCACRWASGGPFVVLGTISGSSSWSRPKCTTLSMPTRQSRLLYSKGILFKRFVGRSTPTTSATGRNRHQRAHQHQQPTHHC
jgi:hypothetical protein